MKVVFLSNHYYYSDRKAGFHQLADAFSSNGNQVFFVTTGFSLFSYLRSDFRVRYKNIFKDRNKLVNVKKDFYSYVYFTLLHPHNLLFGWLNSLFNRLTLTYGKRCLGDLQNILKSADIVIFESSNALYFFDHLHNINPDAKRIYRVSDDIRILRSRHPSLDEVEKSIASRFDLISVPCSYLLDKFSTTNVKLQKHGINKAAFDEAGPPSLYKQYERNAVFVGNAHFDDDFLEIAADLFPAIHFHIIGPLTPKLTKPNVTYYGEMKFEETVSYVRYADIGMFPLLKTNSFVESFTDSLKVIQYRYCKLPIVAPDFLKLKDKNASAYEPGNKDSIKKSIENALALKEGNAHEEVFDIMSWKELAQDIQTSVK